MERKTPKSLHFIQGRHSLFRFIALLMFLIIAVSGAWADDNGLFDQPKKAFTWEARTPGLIHLKLLMSHHDSGHYLKESYFYLLDDKGNKIQFLYATEELSTTPGQVRGIYRNMISDGSRMFMTNGTDYAPKWYIDTSDSRHYSLRDGDGPGYIEIDWYWPTSFAGKKYTWGVEGGWLYGGSAYAQVIGTIEFDEINFNTFDPVVTANDEDLGTVSVPFMCDKPINSVKGTYTDTNGTQRTMTETLPAKTYNGFLRLPACDAHKDFTITANLLTGTWSDAHDSEPDHSTGDITVNVGNAALIHAPRYFKTKVLDDRNASVELSWQLDNTDQDDVLDGDVFEIQRSLTGRVEDFETIGQEFFDSKQTSYTYTDSLLLSALTPELVDTALSIPNVRYRVRRAATSLWGWDRNPTAVYESPRFPSLQLLRVEYPSAYWDNKDEHIAGISWSYNASTYHSYYVWDDRATMTLRMILKNRNDEVVDTINRILTREEIFAKKLTLELTRSCVKYEFALVVDAGSSPVGGATGAVFVEVKNDEDWNSVVQRVNNGETKLNILLSYSPTVSMDGGLLGTSNHPFEGHIDGNGEHFNCSGDTSRQPAAPVSFAANGAVIRNVDVWNTITTSTKYAGSIVGTVAGGTVYLENNSSQAIILSNLIGDGTHGGLVGLVNDGTSLIARNFDFTGAFFG
ncbi:MAG: hypothetical protein K6A98_03670, partial [Prevotella sp.]|nr:hypothetical protein [Prevotella sp.]